MKSNKCSICNDTGWEIYYDVEKNSYARECKCGIRKKQIMNGRLTFANIPETFKDMRLKSFSTSIYNETENRNKAEMAVKCVIYWLNNFESLKERGMGLYLYSDTKGSGKTRMAVSIANELIYEKDCQVKFCTSLQILNEIKACWENHNNENKLLNFLSTSEFLIIDDFGIEEGDKSWINERFYHIINSRYIDKKVTIFTSNKRLDLLKYDDRITNRIKERTFQIPFPEESIRNAIAKENMKELVKGIRT